MLIELGGAVHLNNQARFIGRFQAADAADIEALAQYPVRADRLDAGQVVQDIAEGKRLLAVEVFLIHDRDRLRRVNGDLFLSGRDDQAFKPIGFLGRCRRREHKQGAEGRRCKGTHVKFLHNKQEIGTGCRGHARWKGAVAGDCNGRPRPALTVYPGSIIMRMILYFNSNC